LTVAVHVGSLNLLQMALPKKKNCIPPHRFPSHWWIYVDFPLIENQKHHTANWSKILIPPPVINHEIPPIPRSPHPAPSHETSARQGSDASSHRQGYKNALRRRA
jgi:hypothetical protein